MKVFVRTGSQKKSRLHAPFLLIPLSFFLIEVFSLLFLAASGEAFTARQLWPLAFGALWAIVLTGLVRLLPEKAGRITYGITYFIYLIYAIVQTGYYILFEEMMWISDFRYASEGSDFFYVLLSYPVGWYLVIVPMVALGVFLIWCFPKQKKGKLPRIVAAAVAVAAIAGAFILPEAVFAYDSYIRYAGSDYGRAQSAEAAYDNMFNVHRLYEVCGLFQTGLKDIGTNHLYPLTPAYRQEQKQALAELNSYFDQRGDSGSNKMTGIFEGKNVVVVLMESMDDWLLGDHTPTINYLMENGINFTQFFTPGYGAVRTFNSEFCLNTGSYLSTQGGYAFDYVTNDYRQSLASQLGQLGYTSKVFHYNDPSFYSRGVFSPAMGYEEYLCYADFVDTKKDPRALYDDLLLFTNQEICDIFFREGAPRLNFIITRSAHLSYRYNEVLSHWALKKYPQFKGMTGYEEKDCAWVKAKLVDDMFKRLLEELEERNELENTVIVAMTDHYTYGAGRDGNDAAKNYQMMLESSGVEDALLLERVPCFIWSADGPAEQVDKTLNTADLLPTVLNMMGIDSKYSYIGQDAFDEDYIGYALFPDGSWVCDGVAYSDDDKKYILLEEGKTVSEEMKTRLPELLQEFIRINNLILETDYYASVD